MKTARHPLWATIAVVVVLIGGSVLAGLRWGFRHWPIGLAVLFGILVLVTVDGSYRVHRRAEKTHAEEIAAERAKREAKVGAPSSDMSPQRRSAILAAATSGARIERARTLRGLHGEGGVLRARIAECLDRQATPPSGIPEDVARWEGKVRAELTGQPHSRDLFDGAPPRQDPFAATVGGSYDRMDFRLQVLEMLVRDYEKG
jgi:hypothetical protein